MRCDLCYGFIDRSAIQVGDYCLHECCVDRFMRQMEGRAGDTPGDWAVCCPDIPPSGNNGRIVRKTLE